MKKHTTISLARVSLFALAAGLQLGCENPVPDNPSFMYDVQPILIARCARCHSEAAQAAGDLDPWLEPKSDGKPRVKPGSSYVTYDQVATVGKVLFPSVLHPENEEDRMPPAPSPELTDWELEVIDKWLAQPTPNR